MLAWFYFMAPSQEELQKQRVEQARRDSLAALADTAATQPSQQADTLQEVQGPQHALKSSEEEPSSMGIFADASQKDTVYTTIETPLYRAEFTNVGAGPAKFTLKQYMTWDDQEVQMIQDTTRSTYALGFLSQQNYNIETNELVFKQVTPENTISLNKGDTKQLSYELPLKDGRKLVYTYTFHSDIYQIDLTVNLDGVRQQIAGDKVDLTWSSPLKSSEKNTAQENQSLSAYVFAGGELEQFKLSDAGKNDHSYNGDIRWVSTRNKFFTQLIKPVTPTDGARLSGEANGDPGEESTIQNYQATIRSDIPNDNVVKYKLYIGPLHYNDIKKFDEHAYDMVNVGYSWIRWFSDPLVRYIIIPFFAFTGRILGNYGIAIILFAIAIKLVLYPLTKKSFKSMAAMRELQPEMKALQEKYKDNPQKQQQETMKLYKKAKVNPLGGCLPTLLQFPVLITLYRFFQNSILIRQKTFLWVSDLSAPDMLIHMPFHVPFLGDHLGGLVVLMSATMVVQTQFTGGMGGGGGNPSMKSFQYVLPVILLFVFNNFAAGLSLYYLIYNALSIGQQLMIHKEVDHEQMMASVDKKKAKELKKKNK